MTRGQDEQILSIANASGFPFQLRVAELVESTSSDHGWRAIVQEHPWIDPETGKAGGFIDLVLAQHGSSVRLVVECKRTRGGQWVFLQPAPGGSSSKRVRSFATLNATCGRK